ncbi:MAG: autotransporter-associated beta strand repeat-containing protein, partial [Xanthomonadaceae bacterium]|nr:autotransporter-associated beta strand repeat-containing protein [Xanthomonadaceae bacterium]
MSKSRRPRSALYRAMAAAGLVGSTCLAAESMAAITYYTVNDSNASLSTVGLNQTTLGNAVLSNPSALTTGSNNFQYAAIIVTVGADGSYNFGQTYAPSDTIMILYDGIFDPTAPGTGALVGNDDTDQTIHRSVLGDLNATVTCGNNTGYCPLINYSVTAGHTYTLLVSGYSITASNNISFPFEFYSDANVIFGVYTGRTPINMARPYYLASELGITVDPDFVGGTLRMDQSNAVYAQDFTLSDFTTSTIDQYGNNSVFSGAFTDAVTGRPGQINIADSVGGGIVTFTGTNTYTGSTTLKPGGVLSVSRDANLGDPAATLVLDGGMLQTTSSFDSGRSMELASSGSIQVLNDTSFVMSGAITGMGSMTKEGAGILDITGMNTYTGTTTVNAGTVNVYSSAGGDVSINGGAFGVHGAGNVGGNVDVNNGGTLMMGNGGTINGDLAVASGATLRAVGGTGALQVMGTTSIGSGANAALGDGAWTAGDTFALLTVQNADADLLNLFEGRTVSYALYSGLLLRGTGADANTLFMGVT